MYEDLGGRGYICKSSWNLRIRLLFNEPAGCGVGLFSSKVITGIFVSACPARYLYGVSYV
jgi:hypothetical protein